MSTMRALLIAACIAIGTPVAMAQTPASGADAKWYSEQVQVAGRLFKPANLASGAKAPAVVLAPDEGKTAASLYPYAQALAAKGIVALAIDYRGWGASGGQVYLGEPLSTYDTMRFSDQTPKVVIRRGRIDPELQVQDIRNAITFLQTDANVDGAKIGVAGAGLSGGHVISVLGMDARAKAGVAVTPSIAGSEGPKLSFVPDAATQAAMIKLAREGAPPTTAADAKVRNALEAKLALGEYRPFWRIEAIPETDAIRFITADKDAAGVKDAAAAMAAFKGKDDVQVLPGASRALTTAQVQAAAKLMADWFGGNL